MVRRFVLPLLLLAAAGAVAVAAYPPSGRTYQVQATPYFSPNGGCTDAIVAEIGRARASVLVQAYSFTSAPIARALVEAQRRGVSCQAILDRSQRTERYSEADFLLHAGTPTFIDARHAIAHDKVLVIDGRIVITGSFNFTKSAEEKNSENLLVIESAELAAEYLRHWEEHRAHSEVYEGKGEWRKK